MILSVTAALAPAAVTDPISATVAVAGFAAVVFAKRDVAIVAALAMFVGLAFALVRLL